MFTHLHLHTEYSLLDGLCKIDPLVEKAKSLGMDSVGLTDHGSLYGVIEFYAACQREGLKPLPGVEAYLAVTSRHSKTPAEKRPYHITLLAKDQKGYQNLLLLTTKAHVEGFYHKPRMDKELLAQHSRGLIAFSGCANGEVPRLLLEGREEDAKKAAKWYRDLFGEDFYLELQEHDVPELQAINKGLYPLGRELGFPFVATNDVHYIQREDHATQDILLAIQTNSTIHDDKRMRMSDTSYYLKSPEEMAECFSHLPEAIAATQRIANQCEVKLEFNKLRLPKFPTPPGITADDYLSQLAWDGARRRFPHITDEVRQRLDYELRVVKETQFSDYFLVVWDIAKYAREHQIFFGVRGSAAASLVLYCLLVTNVDPLKYRLVFERFLNVERKEMPDIDMDFQDDRRYEVINYVASRYGSDHVAQIVTFGTLKAKASIRDVGRALGLPYAETDRIARLVPFGPKVTLDSSLQESAELAKAYEADEVVRNLVDTARKLEGVIRNVSTHAAGVVISEEPLPIHTPLQPPKGEGHGILMTQFAMEDIARLGLLKMDFLGLDNFTILVTAQELIRQHRGRELDFLHIPLDDEKTFVLLSSGETTGLFQLESSGMRRYIRELKPTTFGDISAMIALYRPGPMEQIPTFIRAKHGEVPISYPHPALEDILNETYGVIVYQDQVLLIAQAFAGYTLGEADVMRKAMGKKIPEVMRNEKGKFIAGAVRKGFSEEIATKVWDLIEPFAGYAFNKAHSFSYGLITYWTAYIKANYPVEYMAAVMMVRLGSEEKIAGAVAECARLGIKVLPPDINKSQVGFSLEAHPDSLEGRAIRFGLSAIKNVGAQAVQPVVEERERRGGFKGIEDFARQAGLQGLNRRVLESLIKAGAFDSLGSRGGLLNSVERILALAHREAKIRGTGQASIFDLLGRDSQAEPPLLVEGEEVPPQQKRAWERELLGVYVSEHPLAHVSKELGQLAKDYTRQIEPEMDGAPVTLGGVITGVRPLATKDRRPFIAATLEDLEGSIEVTVWPDVYARTQELWKDGTIVIVQGRVRVRDERVSVSCDTARLFGEQGAQEEGDGPAPAAPPSGPSTMAQPREQPAPSAKQHSNGSPPQKNGAKTIALRLREGHDPRKDVERLHQVLSLLQARPGPDIVRLYVESGGTVRRLDLPNLSTGYSPALHRQLVALLGEDGIRLEETHPDA